MRLIELEKDYDDLKAWWIKQSWEPVQRQFLPKIGFIEPGLAAGFLYLADSGNMAWIEWIVGNPDASHEDRGPALDNIIDGLAAAAKLAGALVVFTSATHPRLIERYKEHKFMITDSNVTHLIRGL
jgi:hypothetical protein